jgi:hypothetical protein
MDSLITAAARTFGSKEAVARTRCIVAEVEIKLASIRLWIRACESTL